MLFSVIVTLRHRTAKKNVLRITRAKWGGGLGRATDFHFSENRTSVNA
jgi:hypothetical protein